MRQLAAYGGWNTAGNTLGCVLSHAVIRHLQRQQGASPQAVAPMYVFFSCAWSRTICSWRGCARRSPWRSCRRLGCR
ncbi:MAG: DUF4127 family protein [Anaerolineales bacterium]|nr:DUF4127 family protein [Anaerolineales bacterium]